MTALPPTETQVTLSLLEGGAAVILLAFSLLAPGLGSALFARLERILAPMARHKGRVVLATGAAVLLLRLALLPIFPIPLPFIPDDFSFLLQADTFLHGRLTNPTPALWEHFETIHVSMTPTYASMYFPAQALVLAAGKLIFGHPWFGQLLMSALMCAALAWAFQGWLPPTWAMLGSVLAVLRLGLFSYWVNTYTGAGLISALAGALIVGALPRFLKRPRLRYTLAFGLGAGMLALSRPFEGILLCLPVAVYAGWRLFHNKNRPNGLRLAALAAPGLAVSLAAIGWLGYYDLRAFGKASALPYTVNRAQYAITPYYVWQQIRPAPEYRHAALRAFYAETSDLYDGHSGGELDAYQKLRTLKGFLPMTLIKLALAVMFFAGASLLPPLLMLRRVFLDRRIRPLLICCLVLAAGMLIEIFLIPHYIAPFTAIFYILGLQAMRHLRLWQPERRPAGLFLVRTSVALCVVLAGLRVLMVPLHWLPVTEFPASHWSAHWYGPGRYGEERAAIAQKLEAQPGRQLVLVTDAPHAMALDQWVYNGAEIGTAKVLWARDMGPEQNQRLIEGYAGRSVWLLHRGDTRATLLPYPGMSTVGFEQTAALADKSGTVVPGKVRKP